jgi:hypothetical protein
MRPHPLFAGFVGAALEHQKRHPRAAAAERGTSAQLAELTD